MYGFEEAPYLLPKTMQDRVAYLEIVRKLASSSFMHLKSYGRQTFMTSTLCFGDTTNIVDIGYESFGNKIDYYGFPLGKNKEIFDYEHFIYDANISQRLKGYEKKFHVDDVIRNYDENQVMMGKVS